MTPARYQSCLRLLRGVTLQADINKHILHTFVVKRDQLEHDMSRLARLIGEDRFADGRLVSTLSRRLGHASVELQRVQRELALAHQRELKIDRAKTVLKQRIRKHDIEKEEQQLMDLITSNISLNWIGQGATRKRH